MPFRNFSLLFVAVLVFAIAGCTGKDAAPKRLGAVEKRDVVQKISLNGTVRGIRQTQIQAGYAGYIGKIYVKVGEIVKQDHPLVRVTQTINQPLDEVFPIRAPFAGTVTQILKREGDYVNAGGGGGDMNNAGGIIEISDLRELWITATVPEVDVAKISVGLDAEVRANALQGKLYGAKVSTMSLSPKSSMDRWDRGRVEYPVELRVTNPDPALKSGMTVVADVIAAKAEQVLTVGHEYLHKDKDGLYLVDETGKQHRIETGLSNEEVVEIRKGATNGLKVQMMDFGKL